MLRFSLILLVVLWAPTAAALTTSRNDFYERIKRTTSCEKSYEISASLVSYASRIEPANKSKSLIKLADQLEARQHALEQQVEASKYEAFLLGITETKFKELVTNYRAIAEVEAAQLIQQAEPSQYGEIIQQVDQSCSSMIRVSR